jgi:hypothetical protein
MVMGGTIGDRRQRQFELDPFERRQQPTNRKKPSGRERFGGVIVLGEHDDCAEGRAQRLRAWEGAYD